MTPSSLQTLTQVHVGVLNGKYDLAGSEFKIWPSNYDLEEDNLEKKLKIKFRSRQIILSTKIVLKGLVGSLSQQFSFFPLILAFLHVERS